LVEGVDYDRWNELNKRKTEEHDQNRLKGESTGSSIGHDFGKENKNASSHFGAFARVATDIFR
jgi:hypothetical protein